MIKSIFEQPNIKKYITRINAEERSIATAVVREEVGNYWNDLAVIRFLKTGEVVAPEDYMPTDDELALIRGELLGFDWPVSVFISMLDKNLPPMVKKAATEDVFEFKDLEGNILMLQVRKQQKGKKSYIPVTKWSDDEFRFIEPDGGLPLFGLEGLKDNSTVFIHEGAKSARAGALIAAGKSEHPWALELGAAAHLGFVGGALAPERTDWAVLARNGVSRVYIVADNDAPGVSVIPKIARRLNCPTFSIEFTNDFGVSFDLADDMPESMFKKIKGKRFYKGPSFHALVNPATFMTNLVTVIGDNGKPKQVPVLRAHAKDQWVYVSETEQFVNTDFPDILMKPENLDRLIRPFSDTKKTSDLLFASYTGRVPMLCYRPDKKGRIITSEGVTGINLYRPSTAKAQQGDIKPFMDFMEYLVPNPDERHEVLKWCATLVGAPHVRMLYGLLMISGTQGVGKTLLAERILAPLVGIANTTFPSESMIVDSNFNGWLGQKRLAVVGEIYAGSSWKAANRVKSFITDRHINVNPKYGREYTIENYCHFCMSSNSSNALRIEISDRRWLIPLLVELKWSEAQFDEFFDWLDSGGLSIIKHWAESEWTDYVRPGAAAPMSGRKQEMITEGFSEARRNILDLAQALMENPKAVSVGFRDVKEWLNTIGNDKVYETDTELKKAMEGEGVEFSNKYRMVDKSDKRIVLGSWPQAVGLNLEAVGAVLKLNSDSERVELIKGLRLMPYEVLEGRG